MRKILFVKSKWVGNVAEWMVQWGSFLTTNGSYLTKLYLNILKYGGGLLSHFKNKFTTFKEHL